MNATTTSLFEAGCPFCGKPNDAHSAPLGRQPVAGALSLCWYCGNVGVYEQGDGQLVVRRPTDAEAAGIARNPGVAVARLARTTARTPYQVAQALDPRGEPN